MDEIIIAWAIGMIIGHATANSKTRKVLKNAIAGKLLFIGKKAYYIRQLGISNGSKKSISSLSKIIDSIDKQLGDEVPRLNN